MTGITSWGSYIPLWRLNRGAIAPGMMGEKAIAGFDEDSITMAVAAVMDCLKGVDRQKVDGLFFATTTSPHKEKLGAAMVATAADLRKDIVTADFSNSLRAGTTALRSAMDAVNSGSAKQVLVVAADCRLGVPGSIWEMNCGDGAAAFLLGTSGVIAEIEAVCSICNEMTDVWRNENDRFIRSWESRFVATEGYAKVSGEVITGLLNDSGLSEKDFSKAVFGIPDPRAQVSLAKKLGLDVKAQLQDSMFAQLGDTGTAYSLMLMQAALEDAAANDRFLVLSYGNGGDAMAVKINKKIEEQRKNRGIKGFLNSKTIIDDYKTFAKWRGLLPVERPARTIGIASPPAILRESNENIRLYGIRCKACGTIQYPPQEVCTKCQARDRFDSIRLSDKKGILFTYALNYNSWMPDIADITAIVNFEGGGRIECLMADVREEKPEINIPVEMSFRKIDFREEEGINIYSWKCIKVR